MACRQVMVYRYSPDVLCVCVLSTAVRELPGGRGTTASMEERKRGNLSSAAKMTSFFLSGAYKRVCQAAEDAERREQRRAAGTGESGLATSPTRQLAPNITKTAAEVNGGPSKEEATDTKESDAEARTSK